MRSRRVYRLQPAIKLTKGRPLSVENHLKFNWKCPVCGCVCVCLGMQIRRVCMMWIIIVNYTVAVRSMCLDLITRCRRFEWIKFALSPSSPHPPGPIERLMDFGYVFVSQALTDYLLKYLRCNWKPAVRIGGEVGGTVRMNGIRRNYQESNYLDNLVR